MVHEELPMMNNVKALSVCLIGGSMRRNVTFITVCSVFLISLILICTCSVCYSESHEYMHLREIEPLTSHLINYSNPNSDVAIINNHLFFEDIHHTIEKGDEYWTHYYSSYLICKDIDLGTVLWEKEITPQFTLKIAPLHFAKADLLDIHSLWNYENILYVTIVDESKNRPFVIEVDPTNGETINERDEYYILKTWNKYCLHQSEFKQYNYEDQHYYIEDLESGEIWEIPSYGSFISDNRIISKSDVSKFDQNCSLSCIDFKKGETIWENDYKLDPNYIIAGNDYCFLLSDSTKTIDKSTGEYTGKTLTKINTETGDIDCEIELGDSKNRWVYENIYSIDNDNIISCYSIIDGKLLWTYEPLNTKDIIIDIFVNDDQLWGLSPDYSTLNILSNSGSLLNQYSIPKFESLVFDLLRYTVYKGKIYGNMFERKQDKDAETVLVELSLPSNSITFQIDSNTYLKGDRQLSLDAPATIIEGRTYLPARYVVEPLGGLATWDPYSKGVECTLLGNTVTLWIDNPSARVNGESVLIEKDMSKYGKVVPTIINDRTMVPMRFLAESLGCEVEWVSDTKEIILTYSP